MRLKSQFSGAPQSNKMIFLTDKRKSRIYWLRRKNKNFENVPKKFLESTITNKRSDNIFCRNENFENILTKWLKFETLGEIERKFWGNKKN